MKLVDFFTEAEGPVIRATACSFISNTAKFGWLFDSQLSGSKAAQVVFIGSVHIERQAGK